MGIIIDLVYIVAYGNANWNFFQVPHPPAQTKKPKKRKKKKIQYEATTY